jgi:hypothetical protein
MYLVIPSDDPDDALGHVIYGSLMLEGWNGRTPSSSDPLIDMIRPRLLDAEHLRQNDAFNAITSAYESTWGLPEDSFRPLWTVYLTTQLAEMFKRRQPMRHAPFLATRLLLVFRHGLFNDNVTSVNRFLEGVLRPALESGRLFRDRDHWQKLYGAYWSELQANPLLNCVFHSEVLAGHARLGFERQRGRPSRSVEGVTIAFAGRLLDRILPGGAPTPVKAALEDILGLSPPIDEAVRLSHGRGTNAVLAPLITAIMTEEYVYTPDRVHKFRRDYSDHPEVDRLEKKLAPRLQEAVNN